MAQINMSSQSNRGLDQCLANIPEETEFFNLREIEYISLAFFLYLFIYLFIYIYCFVLKLCFLVVSEKEFFFV
jgi:hypothetical protein